MPIDHTVAGQGKPIFLLPGMEGSKEFWEFQVRELSVRYRTVSCGYPRRFPSLKRSMSDYAEDIISLMDRLAVEQVVVMGESFGGMIAQELAISHGDRLAGLVLCNTMDRARFDHWGLNMFTAASVVHPLAFLVPRDSGLRLLSWVGRHRGFVMDPTPGNADLSEYILTHGLNPGLLGYCDRLIAGCRGRFTESLSSIGVPTLVLRGAEDRIVSEKTLRNMAESIPTAEFAIIPGGGHCCQMTCPAETNRVLMDWLTRIGW